MIGEALDFVARAALAAPFLISGVDKAVNQSVAAKEIEMLAGEIQLPVSKHIALMLIVVVQIIGSGMLLVAPLAAWGAIVLIAFLVPVTFVVHRFWSSAQVERRAKLDHFLLNVAIGGGLALVAARAIP